MPSKHRVGGSNPFVGAIFFIFFLYFEYNEGCIIKTMKKYYIEISNEINKKIEDKKYDEALELINTELDMPYVPMDFEKFLLEKLKEIPLPDFDKNFSLSIDKIFDLLVELDKDKNDYIELINQLSKFNLKNNIEEIEFYFNKTSNKKNHLYIFDILCEQKVDINLLYGNPSKTTSFKEDKGYISDKENLLNDLSDTPTLIDVGVKLLNEVYLTKYLNQKIEKDFYEVILFTLSRIFELDYLLKKIKTNLNDIKLKMERFTPITKL